MYLCIYVCIYLSIYILKERESEKERERERERETERSGFPKHFSCPSTKMPSLRATAFSVLCTYI